ncbi:MAG: hydrolase [Sphingobium sp.]|nr:hydrolase [Sphingobium sp.]
MKISARAAALPTLLDHAPQGVTTLSLDCFDTLIWRNCNMPVDVFTDLPFDGGGLETRMWGEIKARKAAPFQYGQDDVTIGQIYDHLMPDAPAQEREAMIAAELAAEARHCFAFAPVRDLILDAKKRGLSVMIVSDTYLSEPQLRGLIEQAAGKPLADMIDRIFCSCEYGVGKAGGLFRHVLAATGLSPSAILHVGDNKVADYEAPALLNINCCHFEQFDEDSEKRLRLEGAAATLVDAQTRLTVPAYQPHRAAISLREDDAPAFVMGHDVLGPIMAGFADWIRAEAQAMESRVGKPVKLLFLLRDGHLPKVVFDALHPDMAERSLAIELSRFTAGAAGFIDEAAVERYLLPELGNGSLFALAKQMLFTRDEIAKLTQGASAAAFAKRVQAESNMRRILSRSERFASRLFTYLRREGVQDGDAVMLVDLGYNGSVQNLCERALVEGMGLTVAGRYLLLRETFRTGHDKAGWFDIRHYDAKLLHALSESIAIVEQMATLAQGSVVDYREDGTPVRAAIGVKNMQSDTRDAIQAACVAFATGADRARATIPASDDADCRRRVAVAALARLLFLPLESEVALLRDFHHDVNLGTKDTVRLVDPDAAAEGLRRRGLFYAKNALRLYLPGELQAHGLPLNFSIFGTRRFGLDFRKADFDVGGIDVPVMLMDAAGHATMDVRAHPTAQGYYQAMIPIGNAQYAAGIQFGALYDWVQVEEASFHYVDEFMKPRAEENGVDATPIMDAMTDVGGGLYRCEGAEGFMLVPPPGIAQKGKPMLLSLVFRPISARTTPAAALKEVA